VPPIGDIGQAHNELKSDIAPLRLLLVIDSLVSKLPNAIELYLSSVPFDDPVRSLLRSR
jgi:hypothetical protein